MKAEDIVEGLNRHIENKRTELDIDTSGHLILQKNVEQHSVFKAYKVYKYTLWYIKNRKKFQLLSTQITDKVLNGQEESIIKKIDIEFSFSIFNWIGSSLYNKVINGEDII